MRQIMPLQATYSQLPVQNGKATSGDQVWQVQYHRIDRYSFSNLHRIHGNAIEVED